VRERERERKKERKKERKGFRVPFTGILLFKIILL
jgi:hypothetical protein